MKLRPLLLLCLAFGLSSCQSTYQAVTKYPDGSTTSVPVAKPEDILFDGQCQATLNTHF